MRFSKKFIVVIFAFWLTHLPANALSYGDGAGSVKTQINQQRTDEQIQRKIIQKEMEAERAEKQDKKKSDETPKDVKQGEVIYNPHFKLNHINFEGNKVYKTSYLNDFASNLIGQEIYVDDIIELAGRITKQYQFDGYITSYAYVPEQDVIDGNVTIRIVESKIADIDIEGNKWLRKSYITREICNLNGLKEDKVFNVNQIDAVLKTANSMPYFKAGVTVNKNPESDNTDIHLNVKDRLPVTLNMAWDNLGRSLVGQQRFRTTLTYDNLTGFGDSLYGGVILARRTTGVIAGYKIPVSPWGTKLAFDYGYTNVRIGGEFSEFGLRGNSTSYLLRLIQPIYKNSTTELEASVGLDFASSNTAAKNGDYELGGYNLRVLRANLYGSHDDKTGTTFVILNGDFGLHGLGATHETNGEPDSAFQKVGANIIRLQRIPLKESYLVLRLGGQWTPNQLYPMEQYQLGGFNNVRGYQPGVLLGDYGISGTVELRTPVPGLKKILPEKVKHISDFIKLIAFYDFGYIGQNANAYNYTQNFLMSCGAGLNVILPSGFAFNLAVGIPLDRKDYATGDARVHFNLTTDVDRLIYRRFKREAI